MSARDVAGVADLQAIPVLAKDDLPALQAADPPFGGMLAVAAGSLARIYRSPGPINDPQGAGDDFWRFAPALRAAGFRPGDVVLNSFSYHLTPGGLMLDGGLRAVGCAVIPGGVAATTAQIEAARAAGATGYTGTPQFLLTLLERAEESGGPLGFERALVTGAPLPPPLRARLQDDFGLDVYQAYGTADTGLLGYECGEKDGWQVAPEVVVEVLAPGDDRPAAEGEAGQVVVTSPNEIYPLVRFGTGDLSAWKHAPCPWRPPRPPPGGLPGPGGRRRQGKGNVRASARAGGRPWVRPGRGALPGGGDGRRRAGRVYRAGRGDTRGRGRQDRPHHPHPRGREDPPGRGGGSNRDHPRRCAPAGGRAR